MQLERNEPLCTLRHQALGATPAELTLLKEIDGSKKLAEIIAASAEPEKTQSLIVAMIERGALTAQSAA
jgi:hypothetical protein